MTIPGLSLPDRIGLIQTRGGFFDGEFHRWPGDASRITINRALPSSNEIVTATYDDSGDVIFEDGARVRIFDLVGSATYTQKELRE